MGVSDSWLETPWKPFQTWLLVLGVAGFASLGDTQLWSGIPAGKQQWLSQKFPIQGVGDTRETPLPMHPILVHVGYTHTPMHPGMCGEEEDGRKEERSLCQLLPRALPCPGLERPQEPRRDVVPPPCTSQWEYPSRGCLCCHKGAGAAP